MRAQFEENPHIVYDPDLWNENSRHAKIDAERLISFWTCYNKQLLAIVKNIPSEKLQNKINTWDETSHTLAFIIEDYVSIWSTI